MPTVKFETPATTGSGTDPQTAINTAAIAALTGRLDNRDQKDSVRAVSTTNLTLSGTQTVDGVVLVVGDRIGVLGQTLGQNNGIYVVAAGTWIRATDADTSAKVTSGMFFFATEGTANGDKAWELTTNDPITLGTTVLVFQQFAGALKTSQIVNDSTVTGAFDSDALNTLKTSVTAAQSTANSAAIATTTITAGAGQTGGGDLSASRTLDIGANADGSIKVNADDIQVGILATDAQHGVRGGGTIHASVVDSGASGFMTGAQSAKLTGVEAGAQVTSFTRVQTALAAATSAVAVNAQKITGLADPTNPQDGSTKAYTDAQDLLRIPITAVVAKTANYTTGYNELVMCDSTGGAFTITLPTAVGNAGKRVWVKRNGGLAAVTIATTGGQTIGVNTPAWTLAVNQAQDKVIGLSVVSDGANWWPENLLGVNSAHLQLGGGAAGLGASKFAAALDHGHRISKVIRAVTITTDTLVIGDQNMGVTYLNAANITATVPLNSAVAFEVGCSVVLWSLGANTITVAATVGVTINRTPGKSLVSLASTGNSLGARLLLEKVATDTWNLSGDLA